MQLNNPYGLLALGAIAVLLAINRFARRLPVRRVAGLFLWNVPGDSPALARNSARRHRWSVVLEIVAVVILAGLASDPIIPGPTGPAGGEPVAAAPVQVVMCATLLILLLVNWHIHGTSRAASSAES